MVCLSEFQSQRFIVLETLSRAMSSDLLLSVLQLTWLLFVLMNFQVFISIYFKIHLIHHYILSIYHGIIKELIVI